MLGCVAAAGTGIGLGVAQATASAPSYRTAVAGTASVTRTLSLTGVLEPVSQATAAFQVPGTVATVAVTQGQQVRAGQTIASLDPTLLQQQVSAAQAALTAAQAKLAADESGQSATSAGGTGSAGGSSGPPASTAAAVQPSSAAGAAGAELTSVTIGSGQTGSGQGGAGSGGPTAGSGGPAKGSGGATSLSSDQQAVVDAQHRADVDLQAAGTALTVAESTCGAHGSTAAPTTNVSPSTTTTSTTTTSKTTTASYGSRFHGGGGSPTTTTTSLPPTTSAPGATTGGTATGSSPGSASTACASALAQAQSAQQKVAADQQALARAESTLAQFLVSQAAAAPSTTRPSGAGTGTGARSSASQAPSHTPGTGGSAGSAAAQTTPTPAQLASDQATIDTDDANLAQAEQSLSAAVLTSPISGTVASVGITPGETVSSRSSTAAITVINPGSYQTTVSLDTTQVQSVKVGDQVSLTIDGQAGTFHGRVSSVGPVDTSNSSFTYPATIAITSPTAQLPAGSTTRATVDVAGATDALVVPTSAVHTAGPTLSFVYLDDNGKETRRRVTVGVVGPIYTQIRSGLSRGQTVVLADPAQPVPASNTSAAAGGLGGALRGGGGAGGAGFGGGALQKLLRRSGG